MRAITSKPSNTWLVYSLLILTTLFWSSNVVMGRAIHEQVSPLTLSFWRWFIASLLLLPFAYRYLKKDWLLVVHEWQILTVLSLLGVTLFNTILYFSTHSTDATNIALIQTSLPVFVVILSFVIYGRKINFGTFLGVVSGVTGALFVIFKGNIETLHSMHIRIGDVSMLFAVFVYALYSVLLPKAPKIHPNSLLVVTFAIGTMLLFPFYLLETLQQSTLPAASELFWPVLYIAIFPSILAYWFWNYGVNELGAGTTGLFICFIPVFTAIISAVFLNEGLEIYHAVGMALITIGVLTMHRYRKI